MMIEIDNKIIDPQQLLERVRKNVLERKIDSSSFDNDFTSPRRIQKPEASTWASTDKIQIEQAQSYAAINLY